MTEPQTDPRDAERAIASYAGKLELVNEMLRAENARLRHALERYAKHDHACAIEQWWLANIDGQPRPACTCGLAAVALALALYSSGGVQP
jgi:hypothetical protein